MAIKAEINEKQEREYPWIGISKDKMVVLFSKECTGITIKASDGPAGYSSSTFMMSCFDRFNGSITLSNES